jgi:hypothetical protein
VKLNAISRQGRTEGLQLLIAICFNDQHRPRERFYGIKNNCVNLLMWFSLDIMNTFLLKHFIYLRVVERKKENTFVTLHIVDK